MWQDTDVTVELVIVEDTVTWKLREMLELFERPHKRRHVLPKHRHLFRLICKW